jgi:hypothetical protein
VVAGFQSQEHQCSHSDPSELFGPPLSALELASLLHLSERSIQRFASAAVARAACCSDEYVAPGPWGEPITNRVGESGPFINADWEPLRLLSDSKRSLLRDSQGANFAVYTAPRKLGKRGRPQSTAGNAGWTFSRSRAGRTLRWLELPSGWGGGQSDQGLPAGPQMFFPSDA